MTRKTFISFSFILLISVISGGCSLLDASAKRKNAALNGAPFVTIVARSGSDYRAVHAQFHTDSEPQQVFKYLSQTHSVPSWLEYASDVRLLKYYDPRHFLILTKLDSPWPFSDRELVTCVDTEFLQQSIKINIKDCSQRHEKSGTAVRVTALQSSWRLDASAQGGTNVTYRAWMEPGGQVPAFVFNSQLKRTTLYSLKRLKQNLSETQN